MSSTGSIVTVNHLLALREAAQDAIAFEVALLDKTQQSTDVVTRCNELRVQVQRRTVRAMSDARCRDGLGSGRTTFCA
jgi:hypothetical protein